MMNSLKRSAISTKSRWSNLMKPRNGFSSNCVSDVGIADFSSKAADKSAIDSAKRLQGVWKSGRARQNFVDSNEANGISNIIRGQWARERAATINSPFQVTRNYRTNINNPCFSRPFSSTSSKGQGENQAENRKDISTTQDPFDAPTYNIPEKPVTFTEGASYGLIIIAGLGVAALAAYAVFKELIFEPKEYKIFGKALDRVQNDSQVRVRIGSPITGYGQESRNRAARQRIPNKMWTDESGVEHVQINFHVRGPHGAGVAFAEMYKDKADKQWKYISLIVQIKSPSPTQLILESYIPT